ncbi:MAG TPA: dihydroorotase family protein [Acidimicrobiia bacterium]|jgi:allantoinase|nr:dihydroorotase family protein [Acidimicrobiia bacterium]
MGESNHHLVIRGASIVRPGSDDPEVGDIAITDGVFSAVGGTVETPGEQEIDGSGLLAFPGVVDAHQHWGIYNPLEDDTVSESRAAAQGGVTTGITYIRTGQYYLNRGGSYLDFMPEVLARAEGRAHIDYGFHIAPMQSSHIDELEAIVDEFGVCSFKIFMFYGGHGLHGKSDDQATFLMTPPGERYDVGHFEFIMRGVAELRRRRPELADALSVSLHCETAEIMRVYTEIVERDPSLAGLAAYSASRPPHSEGLAVAVASYLAHVTGVTNINLLHLSSAVAIESAETMSEAYPDVDIRKEVTAGHLLTDIESASGIGGKVNPPLRPREDVEALWAAIERGTVDWVVSDHACCRAEDKFGSPSDNVWLAKSGFGGTEYLLPGLVTEASKRGVSMGRIAELTSKNPATRYGLNAKGDFSVGGDGDVALVDPNRSWVVRAEDSESTQEYTPFEGYAMTASVTHTVLRGNVVFEGGSPVGEPNGRYVERPTR